jgi:hypothetical protein
MRASLSPGHPGSDAALREPWLGNELGQALRAVSALHPLLNSLCTNNVIVECGASMPVSQAN